MGNAEEMAGWWYLCSSLCSPTREAAGVLPQLLSGGVPRLSWQKSNINNCIDYLTMLLSPEMSMCLPLERWNYRNRKETISDLQWKIYKATLKVHCLIIRYKKILSGYRISFLELWLVSRAKHRCNVSMIMVLIFLQRYTCLGWTRGPHWACNISKIFLFEKKKTTPKQNTQETYLMKVLFQHFKTSI